MQLSMSMTRPVTACIYFGGGLTVQNSLIGGYTAGAHWRSPRLPADPGFQRQHGGRRNAPHRCRPQLRGTKFGSGIGAEAGPALDFSGRPIVTDGRRTPQQINADGHPRSDFHGCHTLSALFDDGANDTIKIAGQ